MSHPHKIPVTADERYIRAASLLNRAVYKLGVGGRHPEAPHPFDVAPGGTERADCTAVANWIAGLDRFQPCDKGDVPAIRYDEGNKGYWLDTSGIIADATRKNPKWYRVIRKSETVQVGDFVVFGDYERDGVEHDGHIAMVATIFADFAAKRKRSAGWGNSLHVIDCSPRKKNYIGALDGKAYTRKFAVQYRPDNAQCFEKSGKAYFVRPI